MLHPLVAIWLLIAIVLILTRPRGQALTVFLVSCFCIPVGQVVVLGSLHFTVLRILVMAGLVRRAFRQSGSKFPGGFNAVDQVVVLWTVSALVILSLQWMDMQALIHNLGDFLDAIGGYLVVRFLIPDGEAIEHTIKVLAVICAIQGACMINEQIIHVNVFGYLGGTTSMTVRDGKIRSEGVMGCIYAGVFAGASIPLFLWLWTERKSRMAAWAGLAGAMAMVITSNSSTSWMAIAGSLVGLAFWSLRKQMRLVRWGFGLTLVALHLVMKAPVWALIARVDLTGSSSSYHRFGLVDQTIRHFSDWWLLGCKYYNTWGWDMWDLCNQFVVAALTGGLRHPCLLYRNFQAEFRGDRDGKETGEGGSRTRMAALVPRRRPVCQCGVAFRHQLYGSVDDEFVRLAGLHFRGCLRGKKGDGSKCRDCSRGGVRTPSCRSGDLPTAQRIKRAYRTVFSNVTGPWRLRNDRATTSAYGFCTAFRSGWVRIGSALPLGIR